MKHLLLSTFILLSVVLSAQTRFDVSSSEAFNMAHEAASAGDSIVWMPGTYTNTRMDIDKDGLIITAEPYGSALFTGVSRVVINGDKVTFSGIQYVGGLIGTLDVMRVFGSDVLITHVNIQNYTSHKYLVVDEDSKRTTISYCNFENRLNSDDKNILSVLVDNEPGYHKIQHCSFKNFDGIGNDQGIEPIRIGVSTQAHLDSRTLVEYCYFTKCSGDGEIISHKARQNVYRYNTFENNPLSELVLRHGDEGIVYGNFFLNSKGGIRIREGSNHFIFNNYFEGMTQRSLWLMNDPADPLSEVHIYHNTFVNTEEIRLGGNGSNPPSNVIFANNVFSDPKDQLFDEETNDELWINNFSSGNLGMDRPISGLTETAPMLSQNSEGFSQPEETSPVVAMGIADFPPVPLYPGMDYDNEILLDLMKTPRPATRAIGASEYSPSLLVQPHATEMNTGPSYLFDNLADYLAVNAIQLNIVNAGDDRDIMVTSNVDWTVSSNVDWISTDSSFGSEDAQLLVTIEANGTSERRSGVLTFEGAGQSVSVDVHQDAGEPVSVLDNIESQVLLFPNPTDGKIKLTNLPSGSDSSHIELAHVDGRIVSSKMYTLNNNELELDLAHLVPGTYVIQLKLINPSGDVDFEMKRKVVRK